MDGRTRSGLSTVGIAMAAALFVLGIAGASVGSTDQRGTFALAGGSPKIVSEFWVEHDAGFPASLHIRQLSKKAAVPIRDYQVEMQMLMHLIVVRDDFATFAHLHPSFDASTGTFTQLVMREPHHRYYVYADTTPRGIGQQVFRFTLESEGPAIASPPASSLSAKSIAGPYTVTLNRSTFAANRAQSIDVSVRERGAPAGDLHPYLGAAAHAVLIDTVTLSYTHVHPMLRGVSQTMTDGMPMEHNSAGQAGAELRMDVPPLPSGNYKLWIQFKGENDALYAAPFTLRWE